MKTRIDRFTWVAGAIAAFGGSASAQAATQAGPADMGHSTAAAAAAVSPTAVGFGNVIFGGTPATKIVAVSNSGSAELQVVSVITTGNSDFTVANGCTHPVAAHGTCHLTVTFTPHAIGARAGSMVVRTNAANGSLTVAMSGAGCRYFSPAAARFFVTAC